MVTHERVSLRDAADALDIERERLFRLGRYLRLAPGDRCIPRDVIVRARTETDKEKRYRVVLEWVLGDVRGEWPPDSGTLSITRRVGRG